MNIYSYKTSGGKDLIKDYIDRLPKAEKIDGLSVLYTLEEKGIDELEFSFWQGKIYEIKFFKHNRIYYVIVDGNDIYLLHACRKQKNKTETTDKNIVIKRAKELGKQLNNNFV